MQRRNFLRTVGAFSLPAFTGLNASNFSLLNNLIDDDSDRVLVIVHLFGGNDGLNTVIPLDQYDNLANVRGRMTIPRNSIIQISDTLGFHPSMSGMERLFGDGQLSIVQNVGYPNQNRSHFRSTDIWTTATDSDVVKTTGWFGRYFDGVYPGFPEGFPNDGMPDPPAISIGNVAHPTCEGSNINFSQSVIDPDNVSSLAPGGTVPVPDDNYGQEVRFLRETVEQTNAYGRVISDASARGRNLVEYPTQNRLADQLSKVARMISGGLRTKVYTVYLGGFDTHANQISSRSTTGIHAKLLTEVSEAITAFQADIDRLDLSERVLGMTFSEFGRRIRPNASLGTDHGDAGPMFFFGNCVNPGVIGSNPVIDRAVDQVTGVTMECDFRDVYGSILKDWFNAPDDRIKDILYPKFQPLTIVQACNRNQETTPTDSFRSLGNFEVSAPFPNPTRSDVSIEVRTPQPISVEYYLHDLVGRKLRGGRLRLNAGSAVYRIPLGANRLPAGGYLLRFVTSKGEELSRRVTVR